MVVAEPGTLAVVDGVASALEAEVVLCALDVLLIKFHSYLLFELNKENGLRSLLIA